MIEREFVKEKVKYLKVKEHIADNVSKAAGVSRIIIEKTPLGEKIIIYAVKPGLIIGRAGKTISELTKVIKDKYRFENPQIEVHEVPTPDLSAAVVARRIAADLERFGPHRVKGVAHTMLKRIIDAGALGAEIAISGKLPGARAKLMRFPAGYMKKCGQVALEDVDRATVHANLRAGTVGIKVRIMTPDIQLPDRVIILPKSQILSELQQTGTKKAEDVKPEIKATNPEAEKVKPKTPRKRTSKPKSIGAKKAESDAKAEVKEQSNGSNTI